jgi:XTP/dITP diphosphohydrolase
MDFLWKINYGKVAKAGVTATSFIPFMGGFGNINIDKDRHKHHSASTDICGYNLAMPFPKLLLATTNAGKLAELRELVAPLSIDVNGLAELSTFDEVDETGSSFAQNAILKASGYARQSGLPTLADDSGLEVHALGARPGVHSARYGGIDISFDQKIEKLLEELKASSAQDRSARFVCSIAIANSRGQIIHLTDGICWGLIAPEPRGSEGFGFDPIFVPAGFESTFGELSADVKQKISHRARAFERIIPFLRDNIAILT